MATGAQQSLVSQKTIEKLVLTDADRARLVTVIAAIDEMSKF